MRLTLPSTARPGLAALAILIGLGAGMAQAKTTLRWKFKPGDVLHYQTVQSTVTSIQDLNAKPVQQTLALTIDLTWTVKSVDDQGKASVAETIDRMRTTATMPYVGKLSDDSKDADAAGPIGSLFKFLVGSEFTFTVTPRGEIDDVKLPEKLLAALKAPDEPAAAPGQPAEPGGMKMMLMQLGITEDGMKNMLNQMTLVVPQEALEVGGKWDRKLPTPAGPDGASRMIDQMFTYRGAEAGNKAEGVDLTTKFEPLKPDPNVPVTVKSEEASGRYSFDNAAGRITSSTLTQKIEARIQQEGKEIPQSIETVTTMTLTKDKAP